LNIDRSRTAQNDIAESFFCFVCFVCFVVILDGVLFEEFNHEIRETPSAASGRNQKKN